MKNRDIILDFTSLLDVTLIVIFFFVLFSHLDSETNRIEQEKKKQELETAIQQAEVQEKKAKESEEKLEEEIRKVMESDKQQGANIDEMVVYNRSDNVKVLLDMESDSWKARVIINNEIADIFMRNELFDEKLKKVLENAGYTNESTIFCDFVYDGSKPGTYSAYKNIKKGLESLADSYKNLYISETDLSIGE